MGKIICRTLLALACVTLVRAADLATERDEQFLCLQHDIATRAAFDKVASETFRSESLVLADDRDPVDVVLRRTAAMIPSGIASPHESTSAQPERMSVLPIRSQINCVTSTWFASE